MVYDITIMNSMMSKKGNIHIIYWTGLFLVNIMSFFFILEKRRKPMQNQ